MDGGWGAWVAQVVECPTLGFGSGHDLMVHGVKPRIGFCPDVAETAWDSLPVSLPLLQSLSVSQNK